MLWDLCIRYANGTERVIRSFKNPEVARRCVDAIYSQQGYPMHCAYIVRPAITVVA